MPQKHGVEESNVEHSNNQSHNATHQPTPEATPNPKFKAEEEPEPEEQVLGLQGPQVQQLQPEQAKPQIAPATLDVELGGERGPKPTPECWEGVKATQGEIKGAEATPIAGKMEDSTEVSATMSSSPKSKSLKSKKRSKASKELAKDILPESEDSPDVPVQTPGRASEASQQTAAESDLTRGEMGETAGEMKGEIVKYSSGGRRSNEGESSDSKSDAARTDEKERGTRGVAAIAAKIQESVEARKELVAARYQEKKDMVAARYMEVENQVFEVCATAKARAMMASVRAKERAKGLYGEARAEVQALVGEARAEVRAMKEKYVALYGEFKSHPLVLKVGGWVDELPRYESRICRPYLTDSELKGLDLYRYHAVAGTALDQVLNDNVWNPLSWKIPYWVHPNTLTVLGLFCSFVVSYFPLLIYSPDFEQPIARSAHLAAAVGFFLYQTLDAIDGKQARNTKLSSPVGQLMDHGCDSLTTYYAMFITCSTLRVGCGFLMCIIITAMSIQLLFYTWYEHSYGTFRCSTGQIGVTEGQWVIILINLIAAVNPNFWIRPIGSFIPRFPRLLLRLLPFSLPIGGTLFFFTMIAGLYLIGLDFIDVFHKNPPKHGRVKAVSEWLVMGGHCLCNSILVLSGVVGRSPMFSTGMIAFAGSLLAWRLILSSVAHAPLKLVQWPSVPFYLFTLAVLFKAIPEAYEFPIVILVTLWCLGAWFIFVHLNMDRVKRYVGVPLFLVPTENQKMARQAYEAAFPEAANAASSKAVLLAVEAAEATASVHESPRSQLDEVPADDDSPKGQETIKTEVTEAIESPMTESPGGVSSLDGSESSPRPKMPEEAGGITRAIDTPNKNPDLVELLI